MKSFGRIIFPLLLAALALTPSTARAASYVGIGGGGFRDEGKTKSGDKEKAKSGSGKPKAKGQPEDAALLALREQALNPLLRSPYDGANKRALASSRLGALNEEELLLFLMESEYPRPMAAYDFTEESDPARRDALRVELKSFVDEYYFRMYLASRDSGGGALNEEERLFLRSKMHPVYEMVWIEQQLRPRIQLGEGEKRLYYRSHPEIFVTPREATVRYIFRATEDALSRADILFEERLMEQLRLDLQKSPDKFAALARQYSQAPSAADGGLIPAFSPGDFFPEFEKAAFGLQPGGISGVIGGPRGLYLLQLVDIDLPEPVPYEDAQEELEKALIVDFTRKHYNYEVNRLREKRRVESRVDAWNDLLDSSRLIRVENFEITKGDFWRMYPQIFDLKGAVDGLRLWERAAKLTDYELIQDDVARLGFETDPRIAAGRRIAESLVRAKRVERRFLDQSFNPALLPRSDAESIAGGAAPLPGESGAAPGSNAAAMAQAFKSPAQTPPRKRVFRIWGVVDKPENYDATMLANLREHLPRALQEYIREAQSDPARATPAERVGETPPAVRDVAKYGQPDYKFRWTDMGYLDLADVPLLEGLLRGVSVGQFSPVEYENANAVAYYVAAEARLDPGLSELLGFTQDVIKAEQRKGELLNDYRAKVASELGTQYGF